MTDKDAYLLFHMERARRGVAGNWQIGHDNSGTMVWVNVSPTDAAVLDRMEGQPPPA